LELSSHCCWLQTCLHMNWQNEQVRITHQVWLPTHSLGT
jgi:hypothetical protein